MKFFVAAFVTIVMAGCGDKTTEEKVASTTGTPQAVVSTTAAAPTATVSAAPTAAPASSTVANA